MSSNSRTRSRARRVSNPHDPVVMSPTWRRPGGAARFAFPKMCPTASPVAVPAMEGSVSTSVVFAAAKGPSAWIRAIFDWSRPTTGSSSLICPVHRIPSISSGSPSHAWNARMEGRTVVADVHSTDIPTFVDANGAAVVVPTATPSR